MQGCNLHCPWCANPEGLDPKGALITKNKQDTPRLSCEEWESADLVQFCRESAPLFFGGGGVTFTGGEPTVQTEGLRETLESLCCSGIHTVVETNGTSAALPGLFPWINQLIIDFKTPDPRQHREILGPGGETLIRNIRSTIEDHGDSLIRIPLIRGFNTSPETLERFLGIIGEGPKPHTVFEFLTYHEMGKEKWRQCGLDYRQDESFVPHETVSCFEQTFSRHDLTVVHT
jgi:pyruvate formate lyase activating enzyme